MKAKKSLGQNFLKSGAALQSIIKAGHVTSEDIVLEIGPGRGALTSKILQTGAKVTAVEKDRELIPFLEEKFKEEIKTGQFSLIEGDILNLTAKNIFKKDKVAYKLIANIPYYITGEIVRKFFEEETQPERMVLLVQKEVAERIIARDGKESILSIAVKAYSRPRYIQTVKRDAFTPAPNVDSAIIAFEHINKKLFESKKTDSGEVGLPQNQELEKRFFEVMKLGFAHKRKKLGGNLKDVADTLNQIKLEQIKNKRSENLSVIDWIELIKKI